jgi:hypothetical protein
LNSHCKFLSSIFSIPIKISKVSWCN